ncbi:MAG: pseudaminic acid synthase [Bacteriovoracaceae bacterium]|nr:pseudaminic acid synthase [Bacteriovoracaceae bacterium]
MSKKIMLGKKFIGLDHEPFIIAEMSGNHNQSLEKALAIVDAAAKAGAHALKIQTYTPETMTLNLNTGDFFIADQSSLWKGRSLYDLYGEAMTPWEWHKVIKERCESLGMEFFSTPFDLTAVDFLEDLGVSFYKIASFENTDIRLIKKVARTKKPIIISTGMATISELGEAVEAIRSEGNDQIVLLKCTSSYPSTSKDANLKTIQALRDIFNVEVGLSDHTMGIGVAVASIPLGASVVEKHFTLDRREGGVDSTFSMEPDEFKLMVEECTVAWQSIGRVSFERSESENRSMIFRRSLYIGEDLKAGDLITENNLRAIRPGFGLPTKYYNILIGKKVKVDVKMGTPASFDLV